MNNLTSVLIEGRLEEDPSPFESREKPTCSFEVVNVRGDRRRRFLVATEGQLASVCAEYLKKGRGVRVVGSLQEADGRVWIAAEHVEFKPIPMWKSE